ncbi:hypothetical protein B0H11DRAFT_2343517 [Mycena galericulata]|nr:hypothetical protein B0H11DRAFT_2343517 [Mycena galericulata]
MSSYQQYVVIPSHLVGKIPPNIDYAEAATIPLGYATAAIGLLAAQPTGAGLNPTYDPKVSFSGHPAFVFGGSSSVGQFGTLHSSCKQISSSQQVISFQPSKSSGLSDITADSGSTIY